MHLLFLDFETRSPLDIKKVGLDNYARTAEPLLLGLAWDDEPVRLADFGSGIATVCGVAEVFENVLLRPEVQFVAWNAPFERAILKHCFSVNIPPERWIDPSVIARYSSLPGHLSEASLALRLSDLESKLQEKRGKVRESTRLINLFCKPQASKKAEKVKKAEKASKTEVLSDVL